jgi:hypothetical protein
VVKGQQARGGCQSDEEQIHGKQGEGEPFGHGGASLRKLANGTARAYCNGEITQRHSPVASVRPHPDLLPQGEGKRFPHFQTLPRGALLAGEGETRPPSPDL